MMNTALLLIDIQNDYFPGGRMELEGSVEASEHAQEVLHFFREKNMFVVHIQHISTRPGATFFLPETEGVEIHAGVKPLESEPTVEKNYPNSFRDTALLDHLKTRGIRHVVVAGMMTHMCVDATVRAAFDYGFQCTILHDACATRALAFAETVIPARQVHGAFLAALGGVYGKVVGTAEYLSGC